MKAARIHGFGPPDVIRIEDIDASTPAADELVIRVAASGVGPWDVWVRRGKSVLEQPLPLTLGADIAGRIIEMGADVRGFEHGEEIFGVSSPRFTGANAEVAIVKSTTVARKPTLASFIEAAAMPVVAVTALQMVVDRANVQRGQRVLVHGAGGSVGGYAAQLALSRGAHVIGTEVGAGIDYVRSLGVQEVTSTSHFDENREPIDVVIDTVGGEVQSRSLPLLRAGGVLVSSVNRPDDELARRLGVHASFLLVDVTTRALDEVSKLFDAGTLIGRIGAVLSLPEARRAHEMLEGLVPRPPGKIVLGSE